MNSRIGEIHGFGAEISRKVRPGQAGDLRSHLAEGPLAGLRSDLFLEMHERWLSNR